MKRKLILFVLLLCSFSVYAQRASIFGNPETKKLALSIVPTEWLKWGARADVTYNFTNKIGLDLSLFNQNYNSTITDYDSDEIQSREDLIGKGLELRLRYYLDEPLEKERYYLSLGYSYRHTVYEYTADGLVPAVIDGLNVYVPGLVNNSTYFDQQGFTLYAGVELGRTVFLADIYAGLGYRWTDIDEGKYYDGSFSEEMRHPGYTGFLLVVGLKLGVYVF